MLARSALEAGLRLTDFDDDHESSVGSAFLRSGSRVLKPWWSSQSNHRSSVNPLLVGNPVLVELIVIATKVKVRLMKQCKKSVTMKKG